MIGFSSFGVLLSYAIAHLAAFTQPSSQRRRPRGVQALGLVGCVGLSAALPPSSVLRGTVVLAAGLLGRHPVRARRQRRSS